MGKFFNEKVMPLKRFAVGQTSLKSPLERMRRNFNEENKQTEPTPELTLEEKRKANLALAREAKKKKKEANV